MATAPASSFQHKSPRGGSGTKGTGELLGNEAGEAEN